MEVLKELKRKRLIQLFKILPEDLAKKEIRPFYVKMPNHFIEWNSKNMVKHDKERNFPEENHSKNKSKNNYNRKHTEQSKFSSKLISPYKDKRLFSKETPKIEKKKISKENESVQIYLYITFV